MYAEPTPAVDPYSDAYTAPQPSQGQQEGSQRKGARSRSPSPAPSASHRRTPPARRTQQAPTPSNVLGVFGLSIRTQERDLDEEFSRFGRVEKVTIVYDQRSDRSRGFGFIKMATVEDAGRCIQELNGVDLNGRRIRVDYSVTNQPHAPTPGEYMGHRRNRERDGYRRGDRDRDYRDNRDRDRDRDYRDRGDRGDRDHRDRRERDRDPYGRDSRDWRERRGSPRRGHSPDRDRGKGRRTPSRSPPPRSPNGGGKRDYEGSEPRWQKSK